MRRLPDGSVEASRASRADARNVRTRRPELGFHSRTVPSLLAESACRPLGAQRMLSTAPVFSPASSFACSIIGTEAIALNTDLEDARTADPLKLFL